MTEPLDWTTDMQPTGEPLDLSGDPALAYDPYFVTIDDGTSLAIDDMTQFVVEEPVYEWIEVSTDDVVDVAYDWSAESDWLVIDPAVPVDPGYTVFDDGSAYTQTDSGWIQLGTESCECSDIGLSAVDVPFEWDVPMTLEVPEPAPDVVYQTPEQVTAPVVSFDPAVLAEPVVEPVATDTIVIGGTDIFGSVPSSGEVATIDMGGIGTFDNLATGDPGNSSTIVIGGTDFFGSQPANDVSTINIGGIGTFDGLGTGDPSSSSNVVVIGGTDLFGGQPSGGVSTIDIGGIGTFDGLGTGDPSSSSNMVVIGGNDFDFGSGPSWGEAYLEMVRIQEQNRQRQQATIDALINSSIADPSGWSPTDIRTLYNLQTSANDQVRLGLLPSYESEYNAGLVYSRDDWERRHNMSFS